MRNWLIPFMLYLSAVSSAQSIPGMDIPPDKMQQRLPYNRIIQPAGLQIIFGPLALENHAMDAVLSPDGKWLAIQERYGIVILNTESKKIAFRLPNNAHADLFGGMTTYSGITWHRSGSGLEIFWSTTGKNRKSFVVSASWDGTKADFRRFFQFDPSGEAELALPNEILIRNERGTDYLYTVLNGNNMLIKQNLQTGDTAWTCIAGAAPYGITSAAGKLYVTNWAGRIPEVNDTQVAGIPWGSARVDNSTGGGTREGSVSVIDPSDGRIIKEIVTGLHTNEIISDSRGTYVYVTNSNSDNVSVIETTKDTVSETISVRLQPDINPFFGDSPNGLCLSRDERTLYVANGMDNALAVITLGKNASSRSNEAVSFVAGFIPTGAYPSSVSVSADGVLYVTNLEGKGNTAEITDREKSKISYNAHRMQASISVIPVPDRRGLKAYTDTVIAVNNLSRAITALEQPRKEIAPKPIPERIGEPSVIKHVLYIIKENRTYDQVLGDMKKGRGDSSLCIYGEEITPNTHRLAEEFMLLDNFHVSGKSSAEGHQWTDASIVTDYIEKNMRAWFRSYPHVQTDALVYAPTGFLWDNAVKHGKKVRIYGEAAIPVFPKHTTWTDVYDSFINGKRIEFTNFTTVEPVKELLCDSFPSYGNHEFPDIMRAEVFIRELKYFESLEGDQLPELMIMALPNDHTAAMSPGYPTPRAMVADNDLALGRIVEAVTKSKFWKNTVIMVLEDDSQSGWDHISAYRSVALVISPWSRLKSTVHTYYTQPSMVRTIEQILGMKPMNIQDAIANPMTDCFKLEADLTPYTHLPARITLNEMNNQLTLLKGKALHYAKKSMLPEFKGVDTGNDDLLNRILWFDSKRSVPYPSKYTGSAEDEDEETEITKNKISRYE